MIQPGFFDLRERLHEIDKNGDPLTKLNQAINWEMFRPAIEKVRDIKRQSNVGPKGYDAILLFKILIPQSLICRTPPRYGVSVKTSLKPELSNNFFQPLTNTSVPMVLSQ